MGRGLTTGTRLIVLGAVHAVPEEHTTDEEDELDRIAKANISLDRKDYVALAIAALETIFLPLAILTIVILVIALLLR